ncbi:MAG: threonine synthase, partial [Clostridia bacterium]|nr:threonine synthase [Clostridia bacterium]
MAKFVSSRNSDIVSNSSNAVVMGLSKDGGLFTPDSIDVKLDLRSLLSLSYIELASVILKAVFSDIDEKDLKIIAEGAYTGTFDTPEVTPLKKVGEDYFLELWHGPTCAFKDVALTLLPRLLTKCYSLENIEKKVVILTATSGDTGKAALEGFKDVDNVYIKVLYPKGLVSLTQERQMVTTLGKNTEVISVKGNFDDCQRIVKNILEGNNEFHKIQLSSANSINIGRLVPQVVYYFKAYIDLVNGKEIELGDKVDYIVPTGNFGDILAGYFAKLLGLPV